MSREFKSKVAKGMLWVGAGLFLGEGLKFAVKITLARLLSPADFGLMAMVLFVVGCLALFQEGGLESALIQTQIDIAKAREAVFFITPILGLFLTLILFFSSNFIAEFYGEPKLSLMLKVISLVFFISSFKTIPSSMLEREINFKKKFKAEIISIVGYAAVSVVFALKGYGVWSLLLGYLVSVTSITIALWLIAPWSPAFKPELAVIKKLFNFGKHIIGIGILAFILMQADVAFIGKYLGKTELGFYAMAYTFANIAAFQITHMISRVSYPVLSSLQSDKLKLRNFYLNSTQYTMLVVVPVLTGTFLLSDLIPKILGNKWDIPLMVLTLKILCVFVFFRSLHIISSISFLALGKPKVISKVLIVEFIILSAIIYPLTRAFNIAGTAITMVSVMAIGGIWLMIKSFKSVEIGTKDAFACFKLAGIASIIMALTLKLGLFFVKPINSNWAVIILTISGAIVYVVSVYLINRTVFKKGFEFFITMFTR